VVVGKGAVFEAVGRLFCSHRALALSLEFPKRAATAPKISSDASMQALHCELFEA